MRWKSVLTGTREAAMGDTSGWNVGSPLLPPLFFSELAFSDGL